MPSNKNRGYMKKQKLKFVRDEWHPIWVITPQSDTYEVELTLAEVKRIKNVYNEFEKIQKFLEKKINKRKSI